MVLLHKQGELMAGMCMCRGGGGGGGECGLTPLSLSIVPGHKQGELMLGCVCVCRVWGRG